MHVATAFSARRSSPIRPPLVGGCTTAIYGRLLPMHGRCQSVAPVGRRLLSPSVACYSYMTATMQRCCCKACYATRVRLLLCSSAIVAALLLTRDCCSCVVAAMR
ncbi:hypothetical protein GW17_00020291 [Ensete ventricosum]|nr:hypothetical protein GW17_00020291 [Ensete ventricosum]